MKCKHCGADLIPGNRFCVNCGARVPMPGPESVQTKPQPKRPVWLLFVLLALVAAGGLLIHFASPRGGQSVPAVPAAAATAAPTAAVETAQPPEVTPTPAPVEPPAASLARIRDVTATSVYSGEYSYIPTLIRDGDLTTAWVEGVSGQGEGESITIWFDDTCRLSGFSISAGYHKTAALYEKNSRPKEIELTFSNGTSCRVTLEDRMAQQTVTFSVPVDTSALMIKLISVYPGSTYTDTAISEIVPF